MYKTIDINFKKKLVQFLTPGDATSAVRYLALHTEYFLTSRIDCLIMACVQLKHVANYQKQLCCDNYIIFNCGLFPKGVELGKLRCAMIFVYMAEQATVPYKTK